MNPLIRFLTENWGGLPVWWWILILWPSGAGAERLRRKKKPLSAKQKKAVIQAFQSAQRRGGITVLPSVPRLEAPPVAPKRLAPAAEYNVINGDSVYGGVAEYCTQEARDLIEVTPLGYKRAVFVAKSAEAQIRYNHLISQGYKLVQHNGIWMWEAPPPKNRG